MIDIREFAPENPEHQWSDSFARAITSLPRSGGAIYVPAKLGGYKMVEPLHLTKPIHLFGDLGAPDLACNLWFDGCSGIIVNRYNTGPDPSPDTGIGADWSLIRNLCISGAGKAVGAGQGEDSPFGLWMRARCAVEHVSFFGFGGDGVRSYASAGMSVTNANMWRLTRVNIQHCGRFGLWVRGSDTNTGKAEMVNITACGDWSFNDESFLGNTYDTCHASASDLKRGYRSGTTASKGNSYFGCYVEGDQYNEIPPPSVVFGGTLSGADFVGHLPIIPNRSRMQFDKETRTESYPKDAYVTNGGDALHSYYVKDDEKTEVDAGSLPVRFNYLDYHSDYARRALGYTHGYRTGMLISTGHTVLPQWPQMLPPLQHLFPKGIYLGSNKIVPGFGPPNEGTWNVGDRITNMSGNPDAPREWICKKSGTAGAFPEPIRAACDGSSFVTLDIAPSHPEVALGCITLGTLLLINGESARVIEMSEDRRALTLSRPIPASTEMVPVAYSQPEFFT